MSQAKNTIRTFYLIIVTQTLSLIGSQMTSFAIGIKIFNDTGSVTPLALISFFAQVPRVLSTSFAGVASDRFKRKHVMIFSDAGQAVATAILLVSFASNSFELWHLYVIAFIQSFFGVFQSPAFSATVTMLVPDDKRDLANTIQQINGPMAGVIAPVVAGLIFALIGVTGVMAIDLVTFLVAVVILSQLHIPQPEDTEEGLASRGSVLKEAWSGFQFLIERRYLLYLILYAMTLNFLFNAMAVMFTPYILTLFDSEATLGVILAVMSAGPVVGGIAFSMWKRNISRMQVMFISITAMSIALMFIGLARTPLLLGVAVFFAMFTNPAANASLMSIIQTKTPPDMQGRVFAAIMQIAMFATPVAYLIAGPLADSVFEPAVGTDTWSVVAPLVGERAGAGMGLMMVMSGTIICAISLLLWSVPKMRTLEEDLPDYIPTAVAEDIEESINLGDEGEFVPA